MIMAEAIFNTHIRGSVSFSQLNPKTKVRVDIDITGLGNSTNGIHVNNKMSTVHFNGSLVTFSCRHHGGTRHGSWFMNNERHIGDLCNNIFSINNRAQFSYYDELISLQPGDPNNVVDKTLVINLDEDDEGEGQTLESKITGNSGMIIATAIIEYIKC